jgi:hypothetical protein
MRGIFAGICKVVILRAPLLLTQPEADGKVTPKSLHKTRGQINRSSVNAYAI